MQIIKAFPFNPAGPESDTSQGHRKLIRKHRQLSNLERACNLLAYNPLEAF
jgi:hypothetical protein